MGRPERGRRHNSNRGGGGGARREEESRAEELHLQEEGHPGKRPGTERSDTVTRGCWRRGRTIKVRREFLWEQFGKSSKLSVKVCKTRDRIH